MTSTLLKEIETCFAEVEDPRQQEKVEHPLLNIIFLTICGVLCGADDWVAIMEFGKAQEEWLSKYLEWKKGFHHMIPWAEPLL